MEVVAGGVERIILKPSRNYGFSTQEPLISYGYDFGWEKVARAMFGFDDDSFDEFHLHGGPR